MTTTLDFTAYYSNGSRYRGHRDMTATEMRERASRHLDAFAAPVTIIAVIGKPTRYDREDWCTGCRSDHDRIDCVYRPDRRGTA